MCNHILTLKSHNSHSFVYPLAKVVVFISFDAAAELKMADLMLYLRKFCSVLTRLVSSSESSS
jgi:hypothetical protein